MREEACSEIGGITIKDLKTLLRLAEKKSTGWLWWKVDIDPKTIEGNIEGFNQYFCDYLEGDSITLNNIHEVLSEVFKNRDNQELVNHILSLINKGIEISEIEASHAVKASIKWFVSYILNDPRKKGYKKNDLTVKNFKAFVSSAIIESAGSGLKKEFEEEININNLINNALIEKIINIFGDNFSYNANNQDQGNMNGNLKFLQLVYNNLDSVQHHTSIAKCLKQNILQLILLIGSDNRVREWVDTLPRIHEERSEAPEVEEIENIEEKSNSFAHERSSKSSFRESISSRCSNSSSMRTHPANQRSHSSTTIFSL